MIEWTQLVINPIVISNKQMICVPVSVVANGTPVKMILYSVKIIAQTNQTIKLFKQINRNNTQAQTNGSHAWEQL